jgi:hypothetical protein
MKRIRRFATSLFALGAVTLLPVACATKPETTDTSKTAPPHENALVRFVNATTFKEPVEVYVDEAKVLPDVAKDKVTEYSEGPSQGHDIGLRAADAPTPAASSSESLSSGERYTVVGYSRTDGTPAVAVFRDSSAVPEAGKARIRLIHVADGSSELGVYPSGVKDSFLDGVNYSDESSADVDPGVRALEIRKDGEKVVAVKVPELSLEAGRTYTFVVTTGQDRKLRAIQLENPESTKQGSNRY